MISALFLFDEKSFCNRLDIFMRSNITNLFFYKWKNIKIMNVAKVFDIELKFSLHSYIYN